MKGLMSYQESMSKNFDDTLNNLIATMDFNTSRSAAKAFIDIKDCLQRYGGLSIKQISPIYELKLYKETVKVVKICAEKYPKLKEYFELVLAGGKASAKITDTTKRAIKEALTFGD